MTHVRAIALACSVAMAAAAQEPAKPPELEPLVPPNAPWLRKNQKPKKQRKPQQKVPDDGAAAKKDLPLPPLLPLELPGPAEKRSDAVVEGHAVPPIAPLAPAAPVAAPIEAVAVTPFSGSRRQWNKPAGYAALGLATAAAATALYFGAKSRSQIGDAETAYRSNGGAYRADQASLLADGNSKAHTANALLVAAGALAAAGGVFLFAF